MRALIVMLIAVSPALAGGSLVEHTVPGPSLEGNLLGIPSERVVSVYVPPGYERESERRYPTLYLLHGIFDSNETWTNPWNDENPGFDTIQALMDAGIEGRAFQEMIVVVPDSDKTFDSAFEEQFSPIPLTSRESSDVLTEYGIEHTFEMYNGDHRNRLWGRDGRMYTELLPYFSRLLGERGRAATPDSETGPTGKEGMHR